MEEQSTDNLCPDCVYVRHARLEGWRQRRQDKKTEEFWNREAAKRELNSFEEYQREWNFREIDYDHQPSNNGLDPCNPGFAFDKKIAKYIVIKDILVKPCPKHSHSNPTILKDGSKQLSVSMGLEKASELGEALN